jgi:hypothetical protein
VLAEAGTGRAFQSFSPRLAALGLPWVIIAIIPFAESVASAEVHDTLQAPEARAKAGPRQKIDVIVHARFSGSDGPVAWISADVVGIEDGRLAEHWDVLQGRGHRSGIEMSPADVRQPLPHLKLQSRSHDPLKLAVEAHGTPAHRFFGCGSPCGASGYCAPQCAELRQNSGEKWIN